MLNSTEASKIYNIAHNIECVTFFCEENWSSLQKKVDIDTGHCVYECYSISNKYEYRGKCYNKCPENTYIYNYHCYTKEEICNPNCKVCDIIVSNFSISSICTSCYSDQYLYNEKCVDHCPNGYYYDELDSSIKICKCELTKCKSCSNESLSKNLCISCNEEDNYYPKFNDTENYGEFINCYNETNAGFNYYLDINDKYYKECYISCATCKEKGNSTNHNCLTCANDYTYELNIYNGAINCYQSCPEDFNKLIKEKNKCIDDCSKDLDYKYEFRNSCHQDCPHNISVKSEIKNFYCEVICPKEYPFEIIKTQSCVSNCTISETQNGLCKINYISNDKNDKEAEEKVVANIKEEITKDFNTSDIDKGEEVTIEQKGSTITITTTENQKNDKSYNKTTINLSQCEDKIKDEYHIPKNKSLYILKIDVNQEGLKIPKIEYEVYYHLFGDSLIKLNLTVCKDSKIDLSIPIVITESLDKDNQSSGYYNGICYSYTSEDGTDISLSDRKEEFVNNNLTVCEEDCDFINYDNELEKAICSCKVKTNSTTKIGDIVIDRDKLLKSFTNIKNIANIKILMCYKLIFKLKAFKNNYANIIIIIIMLLFLVTLVIFYCKGYSYLKKLMNVIKFFKLNPKLKKKFLKDSKEKKKKKKKKKNKLNNKRKSRNPNILEINETKNNSNPTKRNKKQKTIVDNFVFSNHLNTDQKNKDENSDNPDEKNNGNIDTNNLANLITTRKTRRSKKININIKEYNFPDNLNKKQIYEIFLKIQRKADVELNDFSF